MASRMTLFENALEAMLGDHHLIIPAQTFGEAAFDTAHTTVQHYLFSGPL